MFVSFTTLTSHWCDSVSLSSFLAQELAVSVADLEAMINLEKLDCKPEEKEKYLNMLICQA